MTDIELIERFHTMWDHFPMRARLIRKDRVVLAVNHAAAREGMAAGERCIDRPPKEGHVGCQANQALKAMRGLYSLSPDKQRLRFWVPIEGAPDVFIHFSIPSEAFA